MKADSYPLCEGVSLVVSGNGTFSIHGVGPARPDEAKIRAEVRARYGYAVTLGPWFMDNTTWRCAVISKLKVVTPKRKQNP